MAKFNEILVGRLNRGLQKLLSMKGGPPAPQLATEIAPGLMLPLGVEFRYLEGWARFGFAQQAAGAVGQNTAVRLRNPVGSNVVAVVEQISCYDETSAGAFVLMIASGISVDLGTVGSGVRLDARSGIVGSVLIPSFGNNVAFTGQIMRKRGPANQSIPFIVDEGQEITVLPGDTLQLASVLTNELCDFDLIWRERFLEDSERT